LQEAEKEQLMRADTMRKQQTFALECSTLPWLITLARASHACPFVGLGGLNELPIIKPLELKNYQVTNSIITNY
jgi:hypothetical protein